MDTNSKGFMAKFQAVLEKYVVPVATKISQQRHLAAVRDGLTVLVPVTIIGGFAVLLAAPPVSASMEPTNFLFQFLCAWRDWAAANSAFFLAIISSFAARTLASASKAALAAASPA